MSIDKNKEAETAKAAAEAKAKEEKEKADAEFEAELEGLSDDEKAAKIAEREALNVDKEADYKAQLEEEKQRREKAEKALADDRFKRSERKRKGDESEDDLEDDEDEEKPLTKKELTGILASERQALARESQADRIQEIASGLADSPTETQLIIEIHKNRTFPATLSLREQLEEAHAIANRKRNASKTAELARAAGSKDRASRDIATTHRDGGESPAPKIDAQLSKALKDSGFEFDTKDKLYKKKLPSGKFLVKDPKTGKTWLK